MTDSYIKADVETRGVGGIPFGFNSIHKLISKQFMKMMEERLPI